MGDWTKKAYGKRVQVERVAPMTFRLLLDGQPLHARYNHELTAHTVALAVAEAVGGVERVYTVPVQVTESVFRDMVKVLENCNG